MFVAAAEALKEFSPALQDESASLYPKLEDVREVSGRVAMAVALEALRSDLTPIRSAEEMARQIRAAVWTPQYQRYKRRAEHLTAVHRLSPGTMEPSI